MSSRRPSRSGTILVVVLACLSVVLALSLAALQTALRMRREVRMQHLVSQANLLCEAGLSRAAPHALEPDYVGESWSPELPEFPSKRTEVQIVILERSPLQSTVQVIAVIDDPQNKNNRIQRSLTAILPKEPTLDLSQGERP